VSLDDLYNGKTCHLAINRDKVCGACDGLGGKAGAERTCDTCSGRGVQIQLRQIGPGMVQQIQSTCQVGRWMALCLEGRVMEGRMTLFFWPILNY